MPGINPPPFSFWRPKKKTAVEPSKEKTLVAAQLRARDAPCRAAGCGSKLFCSMDAAPTGARAGLLSDFRTFCAVLHSEGIGQRSNLTSCSFRAFRFAKRCRGGRGGLPLFDGLCADSRLLLVTAAQTLRCASLAWVVAAAIPLFRRGRRPRRPEPLSIVKRTDSHVAPLLGMTENHCHCEEARRADAAIRIPRPQRLPCVKGAVSRRLTEGLSEVDGPFGGALCRDPRPFLPPKKERPAPALSCRGGAPFLLGSALRANLLYWISMLVFLGRTFWAALGTDTCRMPFSKLAWMSSGITLSPT